MVTLRKYSTMYHFRPASVLSGSRQNVCWVAYSGIGHSQLEINKPNDEDTFFKLAGPEFETKLCISGRYIHDCLKRWQNCVLTIKFDSRILGLFKSLAKSVPAKDLLKCCLMHENKNNKQFKCKVTIKQPGTNKWSSAYLEK